MKVTLVGLKSTEFQPNNSDRVIRGQVVYFEYEDKNTIGLVTDKCFLPLRRELEVVPSFPCEANIYYNKYGKVEEIVLVK